MIKTNSKMLKREIPFSIIFTRLSAAIITKTAKHLSLEFERLNIDTFSTALIEREAFRSIFSFGGSISTLESKNNKSKESINKTALNAKAFSDEVKSKLKKIILGSRLKEEAINNG